MKYEKVIIKQIADDSNATAFGLEKYKKSRFPGCADRLQPCLLPDGRYVTGLDEVGYDILYIKDNILRDEKKNEVRALVANLKRIMPNTDLSPTSTFWEDFFVQISTDQDLVLNKLNPMDVIKYHVLVANGYVAPSKDDVGNPLYRDCKYYCHVDEVEEKEKVSIQRLRDRAAAELSKLAEKGEHMFLIGKYLEGRTFKEGMKTDTMYAKLSDFINDRAASENVNVFLKAVKMPLEDLTFKVTVDAAIRRKIIKYKDGHYTRGGANLGKTSAQVLENLKLPEFATEFIQIHEEVNSK